MVVEENVILDESEPILIYEDKGRVGRERLVKIKGNTVEMGFIPHL